MDSSAGHLGWSALTGASLAMYDFVTRALHSLPISNAVFSTAMLGAICSRTCPILLLGYQTADLVS